MEHKWSFGSKRTCISSPNRWFFPLSLTELGIFNKVLLQGFNRRAKISFWISWGEFWSWFRSEFFAWTIKAWQWFSERNSAGAKLLKNFYFRSMTSLFICLFFYLSSQVYATQNIFLYFDTQWPYVYPKPDMVRNHILIRYFTYCNFKTTSMYTIQPISCKLLICACFTNDSTLGLPSLYWKWKLELLQIMRKFVSQVLLAPTLIPVY